MKYKLYIFAIFLLLAACRNNSGQNAGKVAESDSVWVASQVTKIDKDSLIIEDFKAIFLEECKKWPVDFRINAVDTMPYKTDVLVLQPGFISLRTYIFKDKKHKHWRVAISSCKYSDSAAASAVIDLHCKAYNDSTRWDEDIMMGGAFWKTAYTAIRIDAAIYEIATASSEISHIVYNTIRQFRNKYDVDKNNVIPCERN